MNLGLGLGLELPSGDPSAQPDGAFLLLEDASFILLEDGVSRIHLEG